MTETTIALVTGANKGIGLAVVRRLAERGWTVLLGSRDPGRGAAAAAGLQGDVTVLAIDVTSEESVAAAAKEVEERHGRLDVLVNNAGIIGNRVAALDTGADSIRRTARSSDRCRRRRRSSVRLGALRC
jgi:NAD(P)-dependent dehydrogenase (short-subunit alcohol dehydrogenase family)